MMEKIIHPMRCYFDNAIKVTDSGSEAPDKTETVPDTMKKMSDSVM